MLAAAPDRPPTTPILIGCCCAIAGVAIDANTRSAVESAVEHLPLRIMARPPVGMNHPARRPGHSNDYQLSLCSASCPRHYGERPKDRRVRFIASRLPFDRAPRAAAVG